MARQFAKADQLVSIPTLAREVGRPVRTLFRQLMTLHASDRADGGGGWLVRGLRKRKLLVNKSALLRAHPALAETRYVDRDEFDELREHVQELEKKQTLEKDRLSATIRRLRNVEAA